ncbi:unnamed protein product [Hermetia illucens]|uniref:MARVEL domain-containing protein n=1 Tax=Hermetia illucens TaxID=343691 RepID=A0A7R8V0G4_HERIL|nr:unnamed protein product [Hermetia illucens]
MQHCSQLNRVSHKFTIVNDLIYVFCLEIKTKCRIQSRSPTIPGLLKLVQLLLGAACTGVMLYYLDHYAVRRSAELFFLLMAVTFMIATFCLLTSCLVSLSTGGIISKTIYELIYHTIACILILAASLNFIIRIDDYKRTNLYEPFMAASIMGLLLGAVCTGITFWYLNSDYVSISSPEFFFLLMVVTFMIATFCLLISCLFSLSTGGIISKTIYELIYHTIACILILAASLNFIIRIDRYKGSRRYEPYMVASILGLVNAILYCISAIFAQRSYKGI